MPRGFEGERESQRANDPTGGGFGGLGQASRGTRGMDRAALDRALGTPPARTEPGQRGQQAAANEAAFFAERGITATNPYGKQGFFSRMFGIDPSNIDYSNIMSPEQRAGVAALAYDRYQNPFAEVNVLGNLTQADPTRGVVRSGLRPGDVTRFGTVKSVAQPRNPAIQGIASFLPGATAANIINTLMPAPTVNMIEGAGMAGTGIPSAFAEQERMGRRTERMGNYSQPSGLGRMVSDMMNFFTPNQRPTSIQPSDVAVNPMSAYSETGRVASGVPQFSGNTDAIEAMMNAPTRSYASTPNRADMMAFEMGTVAPSQRSYASTPNRADMMAFEMGDIVSTPNYGSPMAQVTAPDPTPNDQLTFGAGEAIPAPSSLTTTPQQNLTMMLTGARTTDLESAFSKAADNPQLQAVIGQELQQRARRGDPDVMSFGSKGVQVPPARPGLFLGSMGEPLDLIPASFNTLGNPAL